MAAYLVFSDVCRYKCINVNTWHDFCRSAMTYNMYYCEGWEHEQVFVAMRICQGSYGISNYYIKKNPLKPLIYEP